MRNWALTAAGILLTLSALGCQREVNSINTASIASKYSSSLNGVWDDLRDRPMQAKQEEHRIARTYSWGDGRILPNSSVQIDLTASPPVILLYPVGGYEIRWAEALSDSRLALHVVDLNTSSTTRETTMDLTLYPDNVIGLVRHWGREQDPSPEERYYRSYGPPGWDKPAQ